MRPSACTEVPAGRRGSTLFVLMFPALLIFVSLTNALAHGPQRPLAVSNDLSSESARVDPEDLSPALNDPDGNDVAPSAKLSHASETLEDLLDALNVMQREYFVLWQGTWPSSIDWTAAVLGTHVAATLSSFSSSAYDIDGASTQGLFFPALENTINYFFSQTSAFYFGENAFSLRNQAYDDMLWVVLDWLEHVKFQNLHSSLYYSGSGDSLSNSSSQAWYGTQFRDAAAHRARIFYELASAGWDQTLCDGGMIWNPTLLPYKNAITNELFTSASIAMYLYFPGDPIDSPFVVESSRDAPSQHHRHDPAYLKAAIDAYDWLKNSNMTGVGGLYADGFHISGWRSSTQPGSRKCDELNEMVYSYNQGVVLSALRGLWLATGELDYLRDGHELVRKALRATGWPYLSSRKWAGLGRGGVMEDTCDSHASCSQDGQTFKSIFFHHLAEFCRPLRPEEVAFLEGRADESVPRPDWEDAVAQHLGICRAYKSWVEHNARAALVTRDEDGKFGQWWGLPYGQMDVASEMVNSSTLPPGANDYRNSGFDAAAAAAASQVSPRDFNDQGRGRTVETQAGGLAVLRALLQWKTSDALS
ncbi:putative alpha-1,6-mannanase [Penicillium oxalicum 114-2]|uniref:Putative alpha-1,6-mannanase n=1 Tax=Penicillium oxalicum (strain 114-2 / CGMCC 5302) TaxID=933388 RepID=S7ZI92_PENO1|nr:putative alpha-1,6-mannanase [Penicillium oxalicum 114-2]